MHKREVRQLLCSMLIGDGCLPDVKWPCFYLGHSAKQEDYLRWKISKINSIFEKKNLDLKFSRISSILVKKKYRVVQSQLSWKYLKILRNRIYKPKKRVDYLLSQMPDIIHLAIWFMDDGSEERRKTKRKDGTFRSCNPYLRLHTYAYTEGEHNLICQWFKSKYDVEPKVCVTAKGPYIRFTVFDSKKLFYQIAPYILQIPSMREKFKLSLQRYWFCKDEDVRKIRSGGPHKDIVQTTTPNGD